MTAPQPPAINRYGNAQLHIGAIDFVGDTAAGKTIVVQTHGDKFGENFGLRVGEGEEARRVEAGFRDALKASIEAEGPLEETAARVIEFEGRKIIATNTLDITTSLSQKIEASMESALIAAKQHNIKQVTAPVIRGLDQSLKVTEACEAIAKGHKAVEGVHLDLVLFNKNSLAQLTPKEAGRFANYMVAFAKGHGIGTPEIANSIVGHLLDPARNAPAAAAETAAASTQAAAGATTEASKALTLLEAPSPKIAAERNLLGMITQHPGRSAAVALAALGVGWAAYEATRSKEPDTVQR